MAGLSGDLESLKVLVAEAKDLAGAAYADDQSTQPLGKKIKQQGDILLKQVEEATIVNEPAPAQ